MHRRKMLFVMSSMAASWRAILSGVFHPASVTKAAFNGGAAPITEQRKPGAVEETFNPSPQGPPNFEDYATVEARTNGEPVYGLDYMMYIYSISPDLMPEIVMQDANNNPCVKIRPKKSWEIKHNLLGSNTQQDPRSRSNDIQPFLPIHLIDGDRDTVWSSFGSLAPDVNPEWIRIDLPIEATVASVALVLSKNFQPGANFGRSLPKELTIKLSHDAWHWETVYESQGIDINTMDTLEAKFAPRRAKQIWVTGNKFTKSMTGGMPEFPIGAFSIGELEVRDTAGNNVALLSRGAGVTVSSTNFTHADNRLTQQALWAPLHYDMGMKWLRTTGSDSGPYQWLFIEKKRGRYEVDPVLDQWVTDLRRCGVNVVLGLEVTRGNPIYQNPPKETNWLEARWRGLPGTGGWVDQTPEMLEAWLRYVDFIVRHFKGRAYIYEVGNEWGGCGWDDQIAERYMRIFAKTYEAVKKADSDARIMPGGLNAFAPDLTLTLLGQDRKSGIQNGKLAANGGNLRELETSTLVIAENVKVKDAEVSMNVLNRGQFGILIRYTSPQSFVMGAYGTCMKEIPGYGSYMIYIIERTGNNWSTSQVSAKGVGYALSQDFQLKMRVEGSQATLTVSDGNREEKLRHQIKDNQLNAAGAVGLIQLTGANQAFTNFRVLNLASEIIFQENFRGENGTLPAGWRYVFGPHVRNPIKPGWASKIDGLSWHPTNPPDPAYFRAVREMQRQCQELGFRGRYYASEFFHFFSYPSWTSMGAHVHLSELGQGVMSAISAVGHSGVNAIGITQIIHYTGSAYDASNCRLAWPSEVCVPVQPSVMYYMWRTLATLLDDFHPAEFPVTFTGDEDFLWFTFQRGAKERMVAVWLAHAGVNTPNEIVEARRDVTLQGIRAKQAWVVDLMNGNEQELLLISSGRDTLIKGMRIRNYPTIVHFIE